MKIILLLSVFISSIFAQTVMCYKKDVETSKVDMEMKLEGKRCNGNFSAKDMKSHGWKLKDTKIVQKDSSYTHMYIFTKPDRKISFIYRGDTQKPYFNTAQRELDIFAVDGETAKIAKGNLKIGQSGMILNTDNPSDLLISYATVIETNDQYSIIEFRHRDILKQDGLPTAKLDPKNGDKFILNHLYNTSLLIVPNIKSKVVVHTTFPNQNFLSEDFFAAYLKVEDKPAPSRKDIQAFCTKHEIGTLFLVIKNGVFIVDTVSFNILESFQLPINDFSTIEPFYTNISKIESSIFTTIEKSVQHFIDKGEVQIVEEKISSYNDHFSKLLEL